MKLQGYEFSINMQGDVALLQKELTPLHFEIPDDELKERVFGDTTQKAVVDFQQKEGIWKHLNAALRIELY